MKWNIWSSGKFHKGEGGSASARVLVRIVEKMLKVLQMLQFIKKLREFFFHFIDPPQSTRKVSGPKAIFVLMHLAFVIKFSTKNTQIIFESVP